MCIIKLSFKEDMTQSIWGFYKAKAYSKVERYEIDATSRIDACLLHKGWTTHSSVVIPLQFYDKSICCISVQSLLAQRLCEIQLIVLDVGIDL